MSVLRIAAGSKAVRLGIATGLVAAGLAGLGASSASAATQALKLSSTTGPATATTVLTVTGTAFTNAAGTSQISAVEFQSSACAAAATSTNGASPIAVTSATKMVVTTPNTLTLTGGAKTDWYLCVYKTGGGALLGSAKYTLYPTPTITAANTPASGPAAGGNTIVITGTNFTSKSVVKFGSVASPKVTVAKTLDSITAVVPAQAAGAVAVSVTTEGGTNPTPGTASWDDYTYTNAVTVSPHLAPNATATPITVTGVGFQSLDFTAASKVLFVPGAYAKATHGVGGTSAAPVCTNVQVVSDTELVCLTPNNLSDTPYIVTVVGDAAAAAATPNASVVSSSAALTFAAF